MTLAIAAAALMITAWPASAQTKSAAAAGSSREISAQSSAELSSLAGKSGLKKVGGKYYYFRRGRKVRSTWMKIRSRRYYFGKNGAAAVGSRKIRGSWYIFNAKGQLLEPGKTKTVKVKGIRYRVKKSGKAAPGWDSARTYCFGKNGRILCSSWSPDGKYYLGKNGRKYTGIHVIAGISGSAQKEGKFYIFGANGKLKQEKTRQIQLVSRYEDEMTALYRWIGSPLRADYASGSCYKAPNGDTGGRDGVLTYSNFTIYTYRTSDGSAEYFLGAESR